MAKCIAVSPGVLSEKGFQRVILTESHDFEGISHFDVSFELYVETDGLLRFFDTRLFKRFNGYDYKNWKEGLELAWQCYSKEVAKNLAQASAVFYLPIPE